MRGGEGDERLALGVPEHGLVVDRHHPAADGATGEGARVVRSVGEELDADAPVRAEQAGGEDERDIC